MERARWSAYLRDPYHLGQHGEDPVESIGALRQRFPFCRILYLLECRALKEKDELLWKERAREWAILVPDRKKLFHLLTHEPTPSNKEESEPVLEENEESSDRNDPKLDPPVDEAPTKEKEADPTPMEQEILSEAVNQRILYDPEEALLEESSKEESEEEETEGTELPADKGEANIQVEEEEREEKTPSNRRFTDWLDPGTAPQRAKKGKEDLIEAFIEEGEERPSPPAKQGQHEFFSSERMARKSTDESGLPVSETLAELYVQQGDVKRAVQAFEKLRLKFPEKSDYFAGRIQELKDRSKR